MKVSVTASPLPADSNRMMVSTSAGTLRHYSLNRSVLALADTLMKLPRWNWCRVLTIWFKTHIFTSANQGVSDNESSALHQTKSVAMEIERICSAETLQGQLSDHAFNDPVLPELYTLPLTDRSGMLSFGALKRVWDWIIRDGFIKVTKTRACRSPAAVKIENLDLLKND